VGFGYLLAQASGRADLWELLRDYASHPLWRLREAVAAGLQYVGDRDMPALLHQMRTWAAGPPLVQRAAGAALCEPRLLARPGDVRTVLELLDSITAGVPAAAQSDAPGWQVLRQGLGYCWSVAVAALPSEGKPYIEHWLASTDPNVRWIMRENLRKARLERMDHAWVARQTARLG
jgi:hypothetical protein